MSQGPPVPSAPSVVQRARQANVSEFLKKVEKQRHPGGRLLDNIDNILCFCLAFAAARDIPCISGVYLSMVLMTDGCFCGPMQIR